MSTAAAVMSVSNELQGIGSVLGSSEYQRSKTAASLRRTLSADMSSKKWLSNNGFCPLKRIASTEEFQTVNENEEDSFKQERASKFEIWNVGKPKKEEEEPPGRPGQGNIWSSIVSQKEVTLPTPYVHPMAKRSRSLSQRSLEICTESLGSETGSDGFSSVPPSETSEDEHEEEQEEEEKEALVGIKQEAGAVNYNSYAVKKSPPRSFPPPLPSLTQAGLHVRSHRVDGRLVLEAVTVPALSQNYFQAQREGGRLLLTLANPRFEVTTNMENAKEEVTEEEEKEYEAMFQEEEHEDEDFDEEEEEEDDSEEEEENEQVMDRGIVLEMKANQPTKKVPTGVINVHRSALMVNKLMGFTNIDPSWSPKLEKMVEVGRGDHEQALAQSLPSPPLVTRLLPSSAAAAASSFNTYDYCWRTKSVATTPTVCTHPLIQNPSPLNNKNNNFLLSKNLNPQNQQELVLMKGNKADYLVPFFKGCKDSRRSLLVWEPYCIATS